MRSVEWELDLTAAEDKRKLATILAIDVVGYSAAAERDQVDAAQSISALRTRVVALAREYGGRLFNTAGDGFMLEFPLASAAVRAAIAILGEAIAPDSALPRLRTGAHLGEVIIDGDDLLGYGVNVAARLVAQAEPNALVISDAVKSQLHGEIDVVFAPLGPTRLSKMRETILTHAYSPTAAKSDWRRRVVAIGRRHWRLLAGAAAALAAALVAAGVVAAQPGAYVFGPMQMVAHSRRPEMYPALSPDGRFIVYMVEYGGSLWTDTELVMRAVSGGEETPLTETDDYNEGVSAFSPTGDRLAYVRWRKPIDSARCEIMLRDFPNGLDRSVGRCRGWGTNRLGWSADGSGIVFTDQGQIGGAGDETSHIRILDLETGETRDLVPPPQRGMGDTAPAMSPDGTRVAFVRYDSPDVADVYVYDTQNQRLVRVTERQAWAQVAWADARNLFLLTPAANRSTEISLRRADSRGRARPLLPGLTRLTRPTVAEGVLALQVETSAGNLWRLGARGAVPITEGNQMDGEADFSRDGTLAFISQQSGDWILIQPPGEQPRRLAELTDRDPIGLRWSPDGRRLVFSGRQDGRSRLFTVDAASGLVQTVRLDFDEHVANPVWSPDGESLVFASTHVQGPRLMRLRLGDGTPRPISPSGWFEAIETPEGVFAIRRNEPGIWRLASGRVPELALPDFRPSLDNAVLHTNREWAVANGRFYFMDRSVQGRTRILSRAIAGGPMTRVADIDGVLWGSLAVDPTTGDVVYRVGVEEQYDIAVIPFRRR